MNKNAQVRRNASEKMRRNYLIGRSVFICLILILIVSQIFLHKIIVDCTWSEWTPGTCSVTCGEGSQENVREMYPEMFGGKPCEGEASETVVCSRGECPGKK